jgi:putative effector of murein hydrolase LrgA (UPF0299 family)
MNEPVTQTPKNPYAILAFAIILPGSGHVLNGVPKRGLVFLFFLILLGWVSVNMMPAHASFFGRYIGGVFVYGLSVIDAYKIARVNWAKSKYAQK